MKRVNGSLLSIGGVATFQGCWSGHHVSSTGWIWWPIRALSTLKVLGSLSVHGEQRKERCLCFQETTQWGVEAMDSTPHPWSSGNPSSCVFFKGFRPSLLNTSWKMCNSFCFQFLFVKPIIWSQSNCIIQPLNPNLLTTWAINPAFVSQACTQERKSIKISGINMPLTRIFVTKSHPDPFPKCHLQSLSLCNAFRRVLM